MTETTQTKSAQKVYNPQEELTKTVIKSLGEFRSNQAVEAAQAGKTDEEIINTLMQLSNSTYQKPTGDTAGFMGPLFGYKPGQAITKPEQVGLTNAIALSKFPGDMQRQPLEMKKLEGDIAQQPLQQKKLQAEVEQSNPEFKVQQAQKEAQAKGSFLTANDLFTKFESAVQPFVIQRDAYSRIKESNKDSSPAGDLSLLYGFMKILDPGSTVREGEFATAANSGSIPQRVQIAWNKALTGERLDPKLRTNFLNIAKSIYGSAESQYGKTRKEFIKLSIANKLDPQSLIRDLAIEETPQEVKTKQTGNQNQDVLKRLGLDPNKYELVQ